MKLEGQEDFCMSENMCASTGVFSDCDSERSERASSA